MRYPNVSTIIFLVWLLMLYGLGKSNNDLLLTMRIVLAGDCHSLEDYFLSKSEPVLMLGYYHEAPIFMDKSRKLLHSLMAKRIIFPMGEGPSCIALDPHVCRSELKVMTAKQELTVLSSS